MNTKPPVSYGVTERGYTYDTREQIYQAYVNREGKQVWQGKTTLDYMRALKEARSVRDTLMLEYTVS